ncbi:KRAB-A domain-containing protein 2-like [Leptopilina heterotoma]|uniref:KRAB-A domain-containing protein 2-like n=1 Tax=Leptopilina heterotoma TaxID=63436 RepID=UPI001CA7BD1B|nr:KRAB-A domain-containing protein 2-like [Leptopilina heterotoma]
MTDENCIQEWKINFYDTVKKSAHYKVMLQEEYEQILKDVQDAKLNGAKCSRQYRRLNRYDILEVAGVCKLIKKCNNGEVKYFAPLEEVFEILTLAHMGTGHGGRDRMLSETSKKYENITREVVRIFLSMCETCHQKKVKRKRGLVSKPILHKEMNSRCQVDLIDLQSQADGNNKFIMVYQDHLTKFVLLRPLSSKRAEEIAYQLLDIFLTFGAPVILQSDNGREFVNHIITELASLWPELKIVHGKPRHSQSQGSVERANQDIENMLAVWMKDNKTTKWAEGLKFIQFSKNRALHSGIKQAPYKAMFGCDAKIGLSTSTLPCEVIKNISTEDYLLNVLEIDEPSTENNEEELNLEINATATANSDSSEDNSINSRHQEIICARKRAFDGLEKQAKK